MSPIRRNIPNILTVARMVLAPIFFILFIKNYTYLALLCFFIASITDALDGFIARKYNLVSKFGELYDPLADKILVFLGWVCIFIKPPFESDISQYSSISLSLSKTLNLDPNYFIFLILLLLLLRDLIATTMREEKFRKDNIILKTNYLAKAKTTMLIASIHLFIILKLPLEETNFQILNYSIGQYLLLFFDLSLYITLFLSFGSLIDYFRQYLRN
tara:strand:- start:374 stop:1021 length:648 start_codon:yes stop_codon:yes gene_type:complete